MRQRLVHTVRRATQFANRKPWSLLTSIFLDSTSPGWPFVGGAVLAFGTVGTAWAVEKAVRKVNENRNRNRGKTIVDAPVVPAGGQQHVSGWGDSGVGGGGVYSLLSWLKSIFPFQPVAYAAGIPTLPSSTTPSTVGKGVTRYDSQKVLKTLVPVAQLSTENAHITFAPEVPPPITRTHPARVVVNMTAERCMHTLSETGGQVMEVWTFNGHVPGPFIRARVGDVLDVTLENRDETGMAHNVDFHAASAPGGGAIALLANQNEVRRAQFRLLHPGLFIYHCAMAPIPMHIGMGMYGLLLVEPEGGMCNVDREYYVMQSEYYLDDLPEAKDSENGPPNPPVAQAATQSVTAKTPITPGSPPEALAGELFSNIPPKQTEIAATVEFSYQKGLDEMPTLVVFNGQEGSLIDPDNGGSGEALKAEVGETVRIYFGNIGPNKASSLHVIGANFDHVYREGGLLSPPDRSVQTTTVPPGGAAVVEFTPKVPGEYTLLDHVIFRLDKGAVGHIKVGGSANSELFCVVLGEGQEMNTACPECKVHG